MAASVEEWLDQQQLLHRERVQRMVAMVLFLEVGVGLAHLLTSLVEVVCGEAAAEAVKVLLVVLRFSAERVERVADPQVEPVRQVLSQVEAAVVVSVTAQRAAREAREL
jgi:hypothetical protein